jgi:phosphate:Na+ symporter
LETNIARREDLIDRLQEEITGYLVELSGKELTPQESSLIPALIHAVNDTERIGDHSENLVELAHLRRKGDHPFTEYALANLREMQEMLNAQFETTYRTLSGLNGKAVEESRINEDRINEFVQKASEDHVKRLEAGVCQVQSGVIYLDLLAHLERVGDHLANIAERAGHFTQVAGITDSDILETAKKSAGKDASS